MTLLFVYCLLILLASLAGGLIPLMIRLTHRRMQLAVSLVAGVMLGVGLLHMLPHALVEAPDDTDTIFICVLIGFLTMFFVERFFCFHHHEVPAAQPEQTETDENHHDAESAQACAYCDEDAHRLTWSGAAVGLTLHTVFAGIALAASVEADSHGDHSAALAGLGTFLVIFLHKPFDAMTISTLMTFGGWSAPARHLVNGLFALVVPLGAALFHLGLGQAHADSNLVAYALAFSSGTFLCIAMSDLLPELQFHTHDRGVLSAALVLGLLIAWGIGVLETGVHNHGGHEHGGQEQEVDPHEGHDH